MANLCPGCEHWNPHPIMDEGVQFGDCVRLLEILEIEIDYHNSWSGPTVEAIASPETFGCPLWARSGM